jgi:hypothetical protein
MANSFVDLKKPHSAERQAWLRGYQGKTCDKFYTVAMPKKNSDELNFLQQFCFF